MKESERCNGVRVEHETSVAVVVNGQGRSSLDWLRCFLFFAKQLTAAWHCYVCMKHIGNVSFCKNDSAAVLSSWSCFTSFLAAVCVSSEDAPACHLLFLALQSVEVWLPAAAGCGDYTAGAIDWQASVCVCLFRL